MTVRNEYNLFVIIDVPNEYIGLKRLVMITPKYWPFCSYEVFEDGYLSDNDWSKHLCLIVCKVLLQTQV